MKTGDNILLSQYKGQIKSYEQALILCKRIITDIVDKNLELNDQSNNIEIQKILYRDLDVLDTKYGSGENNKENNMDSLDTFMGELTLKLRSLVWMHRGYNFELNPHEIYRSSRGKALMIVNTASQCQLSSQLEMLSKLHEEYKSSGLVIIGVPSNSFGGLEPGTIEDVAKAYNDLGINFIMTQPVVIGENAHPFYKWAKEREYFGSKTHPKWNFHKYLFNRDGEPMTSFQHLTELDKSVPTSEGSFRHIGIRHWIENALYI